MSKKDHSIKNGLIKTSGKRLNIGFLNSEINGEWAYLPWNGISDAASKYDVNLITFTGKNINWSINFDGQANIIYNLANGGRLDGVIIWNAGLTMLLNKSDIVTFCNSYKIPVVTIEGAIEGIPCVSYSNYDGMKTIVDHLIEVHGYQRIGFIGSYQNHIGFQERHRAYMESMISHGLSIKPALDQVWLPDDILADEKLFEQNLNQWIKQSAFADIEAVVCVTDKIAQTLIKSLHSHGYSPPDDIAVIGFDGFSESRYYTPPLTTVKPSWYELGYKSLETIIKKLSGFAVSDLYNVPFDIIIRQSCGCMDSSIAITGEDCNINNEFTTHQIVSDMIRYVKINRQNENHQLLESLVESCMGEMNKESAKNFIKQFESLLQKSISYGDELLYWHDAFSIFRQRIKQWMYKNKISSDKISLFETMCQQVRILISNYIERAQANSNIQSEQDTAKLRHIEQSIITTFNIENLMDVLAYNLPELGIYGCYLSLYENPVLYEYPERAPECSQLILAYNRTSRIALDKSGIRFLTNKMVPDSFWEQDYSLNMVAIPFYFHNEEIGFALFETDLRHGQIFEMLGVDISSALHGAKLVQSVQDHSAELMRQKYILDTFMDSIPDYIYFKDKQSIFSRGNKAFANRCGLKDNNELKGKSDFDFYPFVQAELRYKDEQEIIKTGIPILSLEEFDGVDHWVLTTKMPLRDEKGEIVGTFGISRDITELVNTRKTTEKRAHELEQAYETLQKQQNILLISEKMASLGRLTAGIAHEMNTPLATIRVVLENIDGLVKEYKSSIGNSSVTDKDHIEIANELRQAVFVAKNASEKASGFVHSIKMQTYAQSNRPHQLINAVVEVNDAILLLNHALNQSKCKLIFEKSDDEIMVNGIMGHFDQVLTNLVNNAIDASYPNGGVIKVRLTKQSKIVELQVTDQGGGIAPENISKIFDPMFSLKSFGTSTGLGLTIVHDIIVGEFGGTIDVSSKVGEGTTFTINLPLERKDLEKTKLS